VVKAIANNDGSSAKQPDERRINQALSRCLADLDTQGEVAAPFDRATELLNALVPPLHDGDADAAMLTIAEAISELTKPPAPEG